MSEYGLQRQDDFTEADLHDNSGWTNRKCKCGEFLYNDVDINKPEHDFCEKCGFNCID